MGKCMCVLTGCRARNVSLATAEFGTMHHIDVRQYVLGHRRVGAREDRSGDADGGSTTLERVSDERGRSRHGILGEADDRAVLWVKWNNTLLV